jgi:putative intracellular protease/amidase
VRKSVPPAPEAATAARAGRKAGRPRTIRRRLPIASSWSSTTAFVGRKIQPFWIEEEARKVEGTNFIVNAMFKAFTVRDGNLITGQQQFSGAAAAELVVPALGR